MKKCFILWLLIIKIFLSEYNMNITSDKIKIAGIGCSLADILFTNIDFSDPIFQEYLSKKSGDGGLVLGGLVFSNKLESFASKDIQTILRNIVSGDKSNNTPPSKDDSVTPDSINLGGPCIVALINSAQLLGDKAEISFYGAYGADNTADKIFSILSPVSVNTDNYICKDGLTPFTYVFSDPNYKGYGERTFVNNIGAAWNYTIKDIDESFFENDILVFGATALVPLIHDELSDLLKKGKERGKINIVTTVYDFRNEKDHPRQKWPLGKDENAYCNIDLLITDMEEALKISGEASPDDAMAYFQNKNISSVIITHGAENIYLYSDGRLFKKESFKTLPVSEKVKTELNLYPDKKGDTTGCGDNFAGGVIASLTKDLSNKEQPDIIKATAFGSASGGFACFYQGGVFSEKYQGEKKAKISTYKNDYLEQIDYNIK